MLAGVWGRTVRRARAVRTVGYFGPVFPIGQGDRGNYRVARRRTAQVLTQPKDSGHELENGRSLSQSAVFALWTYASPVVGGVQGRHRKANGLLGAVPPLCQK